ncbi:uncharacterized protein LOC34617393 [Cyclospora cayetanensis]|uniref:Uncharacterized protein LOC34617393 n=1 Tax=Cyclospora cayetanensis TaxID=88456 RepID=A0A6P6RUF1_9EIME|nr:uncharacterized protein LOC34617393 [Cyclospora cayetanensis]
MEFADAIVMKQKCEQTATIGFSDLARGVGSTAAPSPLSTVNSRKISLFQLDPWETLESMTFGLVFHPESPGGLRRRNKAQTCPSASALAVFAVVCGYPLPTSSLSFEGMGAHSPDSLGVLKSRCFCTGVHPLGASGQPLQRGAATRGEGGKQERAEGLEERCSTFSPAEEQGLERNGKKTPAVGQSAPEVFEQTAQCGSNQIADSHGELDRCPCQRVPAVSPPEGVSWPHVGAELPKKSSASDRGFESFRARRRRLSPWLRKGFFAGATLALLWACGPSLLNSLFSLLVAYEPSSQRIFTVACLKNRTKEGDTQGDGSHFQEVEKSSPTIDRGGLFDGDSACAVLLHPSRYYWGARPPFASLVVFLQSAALCSLEVVCALGLEPLLPEREAVERRLRRLGPILASLSLLLRPSSSPLQLPCEEWLSAWSDTNRRGDLHTWTRRKYAKKHQHSATAPFFDFIVVGGGTAGTTLAGLLGRLKQPQFQLDEQAAGRNGAPDVETEQTRGNSGRKKPRVLLLEAGGWPDLRAFSSLKIPARTFEGQRGDIDWKLSTTQQASACLGLQESKSFWPRGKALGGSSWLNYMLFVRGDPRDYDSYSKCTKDERWAFSNVLRKFKQIERVQFPADPQFRNARRWWIGCVICFRRSGTGGSISVNLPETADPTVLAFLRSAEGLSLEAEEEGQAGSSTGSSYYAANPDYNGARYAGPSLFQLNTQNGKRRSPLEAFLLSPMLTDVSGDGKFTEIRRQLAVSLV